MTDSESNSEDFSHADVGIVCAIPLEMSAFLDRCERVRKYKGKTFTFRGGVYDGVRIAVVESGIGFARARKATHALIEGHTPAWVLSSGFSGALRPEMKVGDVVIANEIVDLHGQRLAVEMNMPADPEHGLHVGRFVTSDEMVRTVAEKKSIAEQTDAIAVDMESLAVAQVARETKTRFVAVRAISDDMSADLPPEVLSILGDKGAVRIGAAVGAVWKRFGSIKDMWKLREQAVAASTRLATFLDGVVTQLHDAHH